MMTGRPLAKLTRKKKHRLTLNIALTLLSLIMVFPIIWWMFATLKPISELGSVNIFPVSPTLDNYVNGWKMSKKYTFGAFFKNSLLIEFFNVTGAVLTSGFVAYGFSRIKFKLRNFWFSILILTLMLPPQVTAVSQFILYSKLNLTDSYVPLILPHWFGGGAFFIFLIIQNIRGIPVELDEAARIDGAGCFQIYWKIIFPLIKTPLVSVGIFAFIWSWDDFYSQVLYISSTHKFTVGLALRMFVDQFEVKWGELLAMSFLSIIPAIILFFAAQKKLVEGIATTGIKG